MADDSRMAQPMTTRARSTPEQRAWYLYDWANSAFQTTVITVFAGPYLTAVARAAADAGGYVHPLGVPVRAGAYYPYLVSLSALLQVLCMPVLGAIADRTGRRRLLLGLLAYLGAGTGLLLWLVTGTRYLLGGVLFLVSTLAFGSANVVYAAFLPDIATPDERDSVSSKGWALGYLGGGLLLAVNLVLFRLADAGTIPLAEGTAVRLSMVSAALWWAGFTVVPLLRLRDPAGRHAVAGSVLRAGFGQLRTTFGRLTHTPVTLLFLAAYLLYNDGVQTVISQSSVYADQELRMTASVIIVAILLVQFVAMVGAWLMGRLAERYGAKRVVLASLLVWISVLAYAFVLPAGKVLPFFVLAVLIGFVLGGTQALSRSLYSHMIPHGREAEYFSVYEIADRGTSWLGTLLFGLALQFSDNYRLAIISLLVFFVLGFALLARTPVRAAIAEAGNPAPARL
jgi:UMF1 family MFS transporter